MQVILDFTFLNAWIFAAAELTGISLVQEMRNSDSEMIIFPVLSIFSFFTLLPTWSKWGHEGFNILIRRELIYGIIKPSI